MRLSHVCLTNEILDFVTIRGSKFNMLDKHESWQYMNTDEYYSWVCGESPEFVSNKRLSGLGFKLPIALLLTFEGLNYNLIS